MKKQMRILTPLLLGLIVAISVISIRRISDIRDYSKLINYVGIVRGASQRVVKLEMNGHPDDELLKTQEQVDEEFLNSSLVKSNRHMMTIAGGICCAEDMVEEPEAVRMVNREQTILKYIINMVKQLHISTVAEGVEREEQVEFLKSVDCDLIQGFVFYRPMPIREFEKVLAANRKEKRQI